jgi:hypothetical protein
VAAWQRIRFARIGFDLTSKKMSSAGSLRLDWEAVWATACKEKNIFETFA